MIDREKVRKGLEWILDGDRFGFGENWHIDSEPKTEEEQAGFYIQRAIELLKEKEAVEPKHNPLSPTDWFCGKCGMCISRFHDYCPSCGQAVKWDV